MTLQQQAVENIGFHKPSPCSSNPEWYNELGQSVYPSDHVAENFGIVWCGMGVTIKLEPDGYAHVWLSDGKVGPNTIPMIEIAEQIAAEYNRLMKESQSA